MKTLFVMGASSDVGIAYIKADEGRYHRILAHYRTMSPELDALKQSLGEKLILLKADLSNEEETNALLENLLLTGFLPTHILHLPALPCTLSNFHKCPWSRYQQEMDISLRSAVVLLGTLLYKMEKNGGGKVVMMLTSYTKNHVPPKYLSSYITVKYALLGLVKTLSAEYSSKGICINGLSPDMMETKFLKSVPALVAEQNAKNSPIKRNLQTADIVPAIRFLLSEEAGSITGENLAVTGGI